MAKKRNKNTDRKKKISLVFDEAKRKDYLCGFRKRKLERKKKAQEEIQRLLKDEKRRIKQENKESYKKLVVSSRPIPDIEQLLQEEYEDEDVNVKIVELSTETLQKKDIVIGANKPKEILEKKQLKVKVNNDLDTVIPGMSSLEQETVESEQESDDDDDDDDGRLKSKKEVKKILKRQATKKLQKSKVFQMKSKLDRIQNKKTQKKKAKTDQRKEKSKKKNHRKKH